MNMYGVVGNRQRGRHLRSSAKPIYSVLSNLVGLRTASEHPGEHESVIEAEAG
jgi:hypothetical protein